MRIAAIDPGESKCGLAVFQLWHPGDGLVHTSWCHGHVMCASDRSLHLAYAATHTPAETMEWVKANAWDLRALIVERFQLYPWMARQQGFSEFGTAETIGVLKYLARTSGDLPLYLQDAARCKKDGRAYAVRLGFRMADRKLGSGRWTYRGPDFDLEGKQDHRDAAAHGVYWACTSPHSPIRLS